MELEEKAERALVCMNKAIFDRMVIIAKFGRPYLDFEGLCELEEALGLDVGNNYRNDKMS